MQGQNQGTQPRGVEAKAGAIECTVEFGEQ